MREHGLMLRAMEAPSRKKIKLAIEKAKLGAWDAPFAITKEPSENFLDESAVQTRFVLNPAQDEEYGVISEDLARRIIDACDMEPACACRFGRVFELPGCPFHEEFAGYFESKRLNEVLETIFEKSAAPAGALDPGIWAEPTDEDGLTIYCPQPLADLLSRGGLSTGLSKRIWRAYVDHRTVTFEPYDVPVYHKATRGRPRKKPLQ